jgi:DNA invertase Pin-like site-specific DNA recombinase
VAPKLLGYARVSTDEQASYGYGLHAQATKLNAYATSRLVDLEIYTDEGQSGKDLERPRLMAALEEIAEGRAGGLVVAKLDRLTRSVADLGDLLDWFAAAGASLIALDVDFDSGTPTGKMLAQIMVVVAEWERGIIAQRTRDGLAAARAQGKPTSRPAVADNPELADQIRRWRDEEDLTLQAICDRLMADGVPTARGAKAWRPSAVQTILGYKRRPKRRKATVLPELHARRQNASPT